MSRIDEIKERLEEGIHVEHGYKPVYYARVDIEYLLSKLEIAEKALEVFADDGSWYLDDRSNLPIVFDHKKSNDPGEMAIEALQQIRS